MVLASSNCCPVCKAPLAECVPSRESFEAEGGRAYLESAAELGAINFDDMTKQMSGFHCSHCGAEFLNPWLDIESRNNIFVEGHPVHNAGWRRFIERVERGLLPNLNSNPSDLVREVEAKVGPIENYAELGCPFQGLLLHWTSEESVQAWSKTTSRFTSMRRKQFKRFVPSLRVFMMLGLVASNISRFTSQVRYRRDRLRGRWQAPGSLASRRPSNLCFVPLHSSRFWGVNCSMFGDSCAATIREVSGAKVLPYDMFERLGEDRKFDLIGLFNVLDHQDDPINVLKQCLGRSHAILCTTHNAPYSQQHHFGLGAGFFKNLPVLLGNCDVLEVGNQAKRSDLTFLIIPRLPQPIAGMHER